MEGKILRLKEQREINRGLSLLIKTDIEEAKRLLGEIRILESIAKLNDVKNLIERASRLDYYPKDDLKVTIARYNAIVNEPLMLKYTHLPQFPKYFKVKQAEVSA